MMSKKRKPSSIFYRILIPVTILIIIVISIVAGTIFGGGVTKFLNRNAREILHEKVVNRKNYFENEMISKWSNIAMTADEINIITEEKRKSGEISMPDIGKSSASCEPLIPGVSQKLIRLMRNNAVTGAFVVFNSGEVSQNDVGNRPGLYFRDLDPDGAPSFRNADLLMERGSVNTIGTMNIATDTSWVPTYEFGNIGSYPEYFYKPLQAAADFAGDTAALRETENMGYWSSTHALYGDNKDVISYSVPLILDDGTVYGVLGIELTLDYLKEFLPAGEIHSDKMGSYYLLTAADASDEFVAVATAGTFDSREPGSTVKVAEYGSEESFCQIETPDKSDEMICDIEYINLYNANTPFYGEKWAIAGGAPSSELFAFSNKIIVIICLAIVIALILGIAGSFLMSYHVARPVRGLIDKMKSTPPISGLRFKRTHIKEIDELVSSIETLSDDLMLSSSKFSIIMDMASVRLAGFEANLTAKTVYLTKNFFEILNLGESTDAIQMTLDDFRRRMLPLNKCVSERSPDEHMLIYKITNDDSSESVISMHYSRQGPSFFGMVEDVTDTFNEIQTIEHERDHDILTSLMNRRAFNAKMKKLFDKDAHELKTAALLMIDIDNLKQINDAHGHEGGDLYIRSAAECFIKNSPENAVISRVSGDEFYIFYYGYDSRIEIKTQLDNLKKGIRECVVRLPNKRQSRLKVSGGVSWYPYDGDSIKALLKYSDFAMYSAKRSGRGRISYFDKNAYRKEADVTECRAQLTEIIEKNNLYYAFQPIVSAADGSIYAYEALMRSNASVVNTPEIILKMAALEDKSGEIEELTWFKSMHDFVENVNLGAIKKGSKIFINSISNQAFVPEKIEHFEELYGGYLSDIVMEITENEKLDELAHRYKTDRINLWNAAVALDDYGSGYNGEKVLLSIKPKFVKVDMSIIRDINADVDKQKVVENIVNYGHERGMFIVAEGIEALAEMQTVIALGVDYLQGYFIAKPMHRPHGISDEAQAFFNLLR